MSITTTTSEHDIAREYLRERREGDAKAVDLAWAARILADWRAMLDDGETDGRRAETVRAVIAEHLGIRDALIVASLDATHTVDRLARLAASAREETAKQTMHDILSAAYFKGEFDADRCAKAVRLLDRLADSAPDAYAVQPLAVAAWLEWLGGHAAAAQLRAVEALGRDEDCTLAGIVLAATSVGINPDWLN